MTSEKKRHKPQRTCVNCRTVQDKRSLIRLVRTKENGVQVDLKGEISGRGAYLHNDETCWHKGITDKLEKALKTSISPENKNNLLSFLKKEE
jgi:uncharacterized protein